MEFIMKACVTGFGMVDALGFDPNSCYREYMTHGTKTSQIDTGLAIHTAYVVDDTKCILPPSINHVNLSRNARMALHAANQALKDVPYSQNVGVFFSGNMPTDLQDEFFTKYHQGSRRLVSPRKTINILPGFTSSIIAQTFGFEGINTGAIAACSTGTATIDYAMRYLDDYDYVVVGSTDDSSLRPSAHLFNILGALSNHSAPFDKSRNGFVLGEGAGCLILEHPDKAAARGAKVYATLHKVHSATDTESETSPDRQGKGAVKAMRSAIDEYGGIIDVVNAHGTSTVIGDQIEYDAIRSVISAPIFSCKGKIGHTLNASGIIETIYNILFGINHHTGFNHNLTEPLADDSNLITHPIQIDRDIVVLKNTFGFGGRCTSQVIEIHGTV